MSFGSPTRSVTTPAGRPSAPLSRFHVSPLSLLRQRPEPPSIAAARTSSSTPGVGFVSIAVGRIALMRPSLAGLTAKFSHDRPPSVVRRIPRAVAVGGEGQVRLLKEPVPAERVRPGVSSGLNARAPIASEAAVSERGVHVIPPGLVTFALLVRQMPPLTVPT